MTRNVFEASSSVSTPSWGFGIKVNSERHNTLHVQFKLIHIVRVKEGEDFFAIGNNIFAEHRPLWFLNVKQNQQLKLKGWSFNCFFSSHTEKIMKLAIN